MSFSIIMIIKKIFSVILRLSNNTKYLRPKILAKFSDENRFASIFGSLSISVVGNEIWAFFWLIGFKKCSKCSLQPILPLPY